jgi:uncharacterized membrane protein YphA (DoxX/SURF4 family)
MSAVVPLHERPAAARHPVEWLALLALCSAYLQGGIDKAMDFAGAIGEMRHFGLEPAVPLALAVIVLELAAPVMILARWRAWLGAGALAVFTLAATFVANRFWTMQGDARFGAENGFFEHLGLAGAFVLVAWHDLRTRPD